MGARSCPHTRCERDDKALGHHELVAANQFQSDQWAESKRGTLEYNSLCTLQHLRLIVEVAQPYAPRGGAGCLG